MIILADLFANRVLYNRLDQSVREMSSYPIQEVTVSAYPESFDGEGVQEELPQSHPLEVGPLMFTGYN